MSSHQTQANPRFYLINRSSSATHLIDQRLTERYEKSREDDSLAGFRGMVSIMSNSNDAFANGTTMNGLVQRLFNIRRDELGLILISAFFFFCVLAGIMILRPVRDSLGTTRDMDTLRWLVIGTAMASLLINPIFGWLVSRFVRLTFITVTYSFFALSLVGFYLLLAFAPQAVGETTGQVYFVWHSVFNLFCTAVFWALMADQFSFERSKRLFGAIAVGGTLGAITGPWLARTLVTPLGTPALLIIAAGFLVLAIVSAWVMSLFQPERWRMEEAILDQAVIGGSPWEGLVAIFQSRYLLGIAAYNLLTSVLLTYLYLTRLQMVSALGGDTNARTLTFANLDLITQGTTLLLQLLVYSRFVKRLGVTTALFLLPSLLAVGFVGLSMIGSLMALVIFEALSRAVGHAIMTPARHTLFTVVSREDKYKSKALTDTFVLRAGDVIGAWTEGLVAGKLGAQLAGLGWGASANLWALASVATPLALIWGVIGLTIGRKQRSLAESACDRQT